MPPQYSGGISNYHYSNPGKPLPAPYSDSMVNGQYYQQTIEPHRMPPQQQQQQQHYNIQPPQVEDVYYMRTTHTPPLQPGSYSSSPVEEGYNMYPPPSMQPPTPQHHQPQFQPKHHHPQQQLDFFASPYHHQATPPQPISSAEHFDSDYNALGVYSADEEQYAFNHGPSPPPPTSGPNGLPGGGDSAHFYAAHFANEALGQDPVLDPQLEGMMLKGDGEGATAAVDAGQGTITAGGGGIETANADLGGGVGVEEDWTTEPINVDETNINELLGTGEASET
ncbi:uncharacterized protein BCR38DRAFT_486557 [Pseudomassariella vexata]|uniref:Uncharacterized protein n=1 Tax=Pseudomassariella vexata TaxID=1141098 RepID=A0A1Y2DSP4_9PEZI|nr:uncharacterized protein BCR38DRAFT_486557 [Pseudomassariella vexata]ORY62288.1 hypothetical protein BCR38DRAFT_486557 [Pseudomassariella vexata]